MGGDPKTNTKTTPELFYYGFQFPEIEIPEWNLIRFEPGFEEGDSRSFVGFWQNEDAPQKVIRIRVIESASEQHSHYNLESQLHLSAAHHAASSTSSHPEILELVKEWSDGLNLKKEKIHQSPENHGSLKLILGNLNIEVNQAGTEWVNLSSILHLLQKLTRKNETNAKSTPAYLPDTGYGLKLIEKGREELILPAKPNPGFFVVKAESSVDSISLKNGKIILETTGKVPSIQVFFFEGKGKAYQLQRSDRFT